jgi:hypothetical protein
MRFEEFIRRCRTEWPEFTDHKSLEKSRNPTGRELAGVLDNVPGMATENKLKLLNLAVAALEPDEVYVEVGCYKGATLVGAALGNLNHPRHAIIIRPGGTGSRSIATEDPQEPCRAILADHASRCANSSTTIFF